MSSEGTRKSSGLSDNFRPAKVDEKKSEFDKSSVAMPVKAMRLGRYSGFEKILPSRAADPTAGKKD